MDGSDWHRSKPVPAERMWTRGHSGSDGRGPRAARRPKGEDTISHANLHATVDDRGGATGATGLPPALVSSLSRHEGARRAAETILRSLDDDKAFDLVVIDLSDENVYADTLIVASGRSDRHVGAIAAHAVDKLGKAGTKGIQVEGDGPCDWVLIDAGDVIVHLFRPEIRSFYKIEKMWGVETPEARNPAEAFLHEDDKLGDRLDA